MLAADFGDVRPDVQRLLPIQRARIDLEHVADASPKRLGLGPIRSVDPKVRKHGFERANGFPRFVHAHEGRQGDVGPGQPLLRIDTSSAEIGEQLREGAGVIIGG